MTKLVTVVRTYFQSGNYRNNTVEIDIPGEAAELILKYWQERGISNCAKAKFLASNQTGNCFMRDNENDKDLAGLFGMYQEETQEEEVFELHFEDEEVFKQHFEDEEVFEQHFKDEEEDDE